MRNVRKTKVIATLGPSCDSPETVREMIRAGMNVARLNLSHGRHAEHRKRIEQLREVADELGANVAVMLDTRGTEIRTGVLAGGEARLEPGQRFLLRAETAPGDASGVFVSPLDLLTELRAGERVLLDDGRIELRVVSVGREAIQCEVARGGRLGDRKGVNLPDSEIARRPLSSDERDDLRFAAEVGVEYVAASFVHGAEDVNEIRRVLGEHGTDIPVIAKIESRDAVRNLDEIVDAANGTMVARGDLGVELPLAEVPLVQKRIIRTTVMNGKPVITATQMLSSMEDRPTPTRAEVSDVANAILDGTSAVMLSGETAAGAHPVESVATIAAVALRAEGSLHEYGYLQHIESEPAHVVAEAVSQAAIAMANHLDAAAILTLTETGYTSRQISKYRPACPILAITASLPVVRKLALNWGVTALRLEGRELDDEARLAFGIARARELGLVAAGDVVVATAGTEGASGSTDAIRVLTVRD